MPACEVTRNHTIHFFRKGVGQIARSETAFDMAEWNAPIEGGECRHHDGGRIAEHGTLRKTGGAS